MSLGYSIQVLSDSVTPALRKRIAACSPQRLAAATGPAVAKLFSQHLRGKGPNKKGWPSTGFYSAAAKATNWQETPEGALVSINKIGINQRYRGGEIKPVNARALTIPISPLSYGHRASDFPGAFLLKTAKGAFIVQKQDAPAAGEKKPAIWKRIKRMGGNASVRLKAALNFLFRLSSGVNQSADPDVLPAREEIAATVKDALLAAVRGSEGAT